MTSIEPELVACFLFAVSAPPLGVYFLTVWQAYKYQHSRGALKCLERSTLDPP